MTSILRPKCSLCKHYLGMQSSAEKLTYEERLKTLNEKTGYCKAFPKGTWIPKEIWFEEIVHDKPYSGDHGILYEPRYENKALPPPGAADEGGE